MEEVNAAAARSESISTEEKSSNKDLDSQKIATELRLEFLNILTSLEGRAANFNLYKKSSPSSGTFRGSDRDILHFGVSDFETPTGVLKSAIVRTTDIDCMTICLEFDADSGTGNHQNTMKTQAK